MGLEYWHWLILGMMLILAELFIPGFTIFWFGLGAMAVGGLLLILPGLGLTGQLLLWTISSVLMTVFWFMVMKPRMVDKTKAGMSKEALLGETGQVIRVPDGERRGLVRFTKPLLGSDEWSFLCDEPVQIGDRVQIRDVSGNTLIVIPKPNK
ncbi:MAG: NfeD family protein [Desulfomicrobium sp.]|jgi:membrane protein implicated in regulation of membrane protease activity|nr:NfeD family protein [Desulfomicrobium sp.]NLV96587.1 NfeD family protein [Desulfovibrionales bacterium]